MKLANDNNSDAGMKTAFQVLGIQALITLLSTASAVVFFDERIAYSVLTGGCCAIVPSAYLAMRALNLATDASPEQMLRAFYTGGALKFAMTIAMLIVAMLALDVAFAALIAGYAAAASGYGLALLLPVPGAEITDNNQKLREI